MSKIFWFTRLFIYSLLFKNIKMPGYLGKPIHLMNVRKFKIGKNVRIFPHCRIEVYGDGELEIMSDVSIAQNVHITSAGTLTIMSGTSITANVCITNIDHEYSDITTPVPKQPLNVSDTIIGENCFIGTGAMIQAGTILGRHNIVGANSVVRGEFPDFCVIAGSPAKILKKYNMKTKVWEKP